MSMNKILTIFLYLLVAMLWPLFMLGMWFDEKYRQPKFRHLVGPEVMEALRKLDVGDFIYVNDDPVEVLDRFGLDQVVVTLQKYNIVSQNGCVRLDEEMVGEAGRRRALNVSFWKIALQDGRVRIVVDPHL